ncbi:MAG TPA: hypothetical protein VGI35_09115, partial [Steroidobacteraceae bacterium]
NDAQDDRATRAEGDARFDDDAGRGQFATHRAPTAGLAVLAGFIPQAVTETVEADRLSRGDGIELKLEFGLVARDRLTAEIA